MEKIIDVKCPGCDYVGIIKDWIVQGHKGRMPNCPDCGSKMIQTGYFYKDKNGEISKEKPTIFTKIKKLWAKK